MFSTIRPKVSSLILLFIISILEGVVSFSGFVVLVFLVSGGINEFEFIPKYLISFKYLFLFFLIRFIIGFVMQIFKRKVLIHMSENILLKIWTHCDKNNESELNPRLLSNDLLWITQGYQSISVFISEMIMALFIIGGLIINIKLSFLTYSILLFSVISIGLTLLYLRKLIKNLTQRIFKDGSAFSDRVTYYFKHFLPITLRKGNNEFKLKSRLNYYGFLTSVVTKSTVKALTPFSIEFIGIISCLVVVFIAEDLDKIAFLAFVIRLISSFNRLSNAYQGIVGKRAIETQIYNNENS